MAVVIHCGSGPNRGHYISIVKSHGFWLLFDDDMVDVSILIFSAFGFLTYLADVNLLILAKTLTLSQISSIPD